MRTTILFTILTLVCLSGTTVYAADVEHGQKLHSTYCMNCHTSSVYTRPNRRIDSLEALNRQVQRCETALGVKWPAEDVADVVQYLNDNFYKFK